MHRISEKAITGVEEGCKPAGVKPGRKVAPRKALPKRFIGLPLRRVALLCACAEHAEVTRIDEGNGETANTAADSDYMHQGGPEGACRTTREPSDPGADRRTDGRADEFPDCGLGRRSLGHHPPPPGLGQPTPMQGGEG